MLSSCINSPPFGIEWIPKGIILGLRMDRVKQNLVIEMAKKAGIKEIYKSCINNNNTLGVNSLKC